jgi:hypothetical protein
MELFYLEHNSIPIKVKSLVIGSSILAEDENRKQYYDKAYRFKEYTKGMMTLIANIRAFKQSISKRELTVINNQKSYYSSLGDDVGVNQMLLWKYNRLNMKHLEMIEYYYERYNESCEIFLNLK